MREFITNNLMLIHTGTAGQKITGVFMLSFFPAIGVSLMEKFTAWYIDNHIFIAMLIGAIIADLVAGVWKHLILHTFSFKNLLTGFIEKAGIIVLACGDLTLIKLSDGTYKEVSRTSSPALEPTYKEFSTNTLEYKADQYVYSGEEATLTKIDGGSEGNRLRITGGENGTLTIESVSGNIKVNSQAALSDASKFVDFIYVNNIWTEIDRG